MKCEILIGMIASGKSTYCRKRAHEGAIIINDDAIVNSLHADQYVCYKKSLKPLYKSIENMAVHFAAGNGLDVVIDRPNLNPNTRKRYIELARSLDYEDIEGILFKIETPEIHAQRRTNADSRGKEYGEWLEAAKYHFSFYKEPSIEEGFTKIRAQDF